MLDDLLCVVFDLFLGQSLSPSRTVVEVSNSLPWPDAIPKLSDAENKLALTSLERCFVRKRGHHNHSVSPGLAFGDHDRVSLLNVLLSVISIKIP